MFVTESVSEQRREKKPSERARLLLASWRGGGKRKGKKNTMSTVKRPRGRVSELCWEGGGTRGRRRGRQELNNLLCYWLMLHCRHLELIAAFFPFPSIFICFAVLDLSMVYWMHSIFPIPTV